MQKRIEIVIANSQTGEIYQCYNELVQMDYNCNPLRRFHDFADGFYRVFCDELKYPFAVIQIISLDFNKPIPATLPYVY